ncbi:MAG: aminodeoxychorismate lyase [Mycobacterium sp.]
MATRSEIVVTLDGLAVERNQPIVHADDPMFSRGDGVFETLLVRDGRACLLDAHLERLARSAAIVGLPAPDLAGWSATAATACALWPGAGDAVLRLVFGRERGGGATGFVTLSEMPARAFASRRDGVSAMTLDRGVMAAGATEAPWSLAGTKSLSYAINAAALRHADGLGIGDVVLLSTDGFVLEGPRSSVVIADGDGSLVTPPTTLPILPGTTVQAVFDVARAHGRVCQSRPLRVGDLIAAQGVWLLSSITLAARVHTLDGHPLPVAPDGADIAALVDEAIDGGQ